MTACLMPPGDVGLLADEKSSGVGPDAVRILEKQRDIARQYLTAPYTSATLRSSIEAVLNVVSEAGSPNWDAAGARAVSSQAVERAIRLLRHVPATIPVPDVFADADGDVVLDWSRSPRCTFTVTVSARGELYYAGLFGTNRMRGKETVFVDEVPEAVRSGLRRVFED